MTSNNNLKTLIDKVANFIIIGVTFLVPLFFLPITTEFFSFNKISLITVATIILLIICGLKIVLGSKIEFIKSPLDKASSIMLGVTLLSSIFSISKGDSMYGSAGRWVGFINLMIFTIYFYLSTPLLKELRDIKKVLTAFLAGSTISTVIAILGYYSIHLGKADYLTSSNFTLEGSISNTILVAAVSAVLSLALLVYENKQSKKISLMGTFFINFLYVALTGELLGWAILTIGILLTLVFNSRSKIKEHRIDLISIGFSSLIIIAMVVIPTTRNVIINTNYRTDTVLPLKETWVIATSTIQDHPILSTGLGTFYVNFSRYRPLSLNSSPYWDVQFNLPFNTILEVLITLGIVGFIAFLYLSWKIILFSLETKKLNIDNGFSKVISILTLTILSSMVFTFPSIVSIFITFLSLSLLVAINSISTEQNKAVETVSIGVSEFMSLGSDIPDNISKNYARYVLSIPIFLLAGYISYIGYKNYAGEYFMRKSITATLNNNGAEAYTYQAKAIEKNPRRDYYQTSYARINLALANTLASKENLTDAEKQTIQTLLSQAIRSSKVASENLNPLNARNWETRAVIYRALLNTAQNASDWTINSYNTAIQLDPSNPSLRVALGGIYYSLGDFLSAANQFRQATLLKQDYANAHYNFAMALVNLKEYADAKTELEITKLLVQEGTPDYETVVAQISSLEELVNLSETVAEDNKPTIEEIAGTEESTETPQEPIENVGEKQPEENLDIEALPTE